MFFYKKSHKMCPIEFDVFINKVSIASIKIINCVFHPIVVDENVLILNPKTISFFVHNSFMPSVKIIKKDEHIEIEYFLKNTIKIPFTIMLFLYLSIGIMILVFNNTDERFLISCFLLCICALLFFVSIIIFTYSIKQLEKVFDEVLSKKNQSGDS